MGKSKKSDKKSDRKSKKKHKKSDKYKHKKSKKSSKDRSKERASSSKAVQEPTREATPPPPQEEEDFAIPVDLMNIKSHAPQTAEEYQKRQSYIRRETDPTTGRVRLIKGDGEVLEEIVSKTRHQDINKSATKADGAYFAEKTVGKRKRS